MDDCWVCGFHSRIDGVSSIDVEVTDKDPDMGSKTMSLVFSL